MTDDATLYRRVRSRLREIEPLRRAYHFLYAVGTALRDSSDRSRAQFEGFYSGGEDAWHYAGPLEQQRIALEFGLLDAASSGRNFASALEVGCAEGFFTERLAARCDNLVAVDISQRSIERAARRCAAWPAVSFECWDVRRWPAGRREAYELITAMHVLEYVRSPFAMRRIRARMVDSLRPGGHLLISSVYQGTYGERSWWGRLLLQGGNWINGYFAAHPQLRVVATSESDLAVCRSRDVLLRKALRP